MEEKKTLEKMNESNVQVDAPASEQPSVGTFEEHPISTLEEPVELDKPNQNSVHPQGVPSAMPNQGIMTLEERIEQAVLATGTDINILDLPTLQAADKVMVVSGNSIGYMAMDKLASVVGEKIAVTDSVLELLSFALLGQTKANTQSYKYDMNTISGTTFALCSRDTLNNPLSGSKYGLFIQFNVPYESSRTGFSIQFVFSSFDSSKKEFFYRTVWNSNIVGTWNKVSVS